MTLINYAIYQTSFWLSGIVFTHTMERREDFKKRFVSFSLGIILMTCLYPVLFQSQSPFLEALIRGVSYVIMMFFLYCCWEISLSIAMYNMVWGASIWQVLSEINNMVVLNLQKIGASEVLQVIVTMVVFLVGLGAPMLTIAKWMPKDRKKQMILIVLNNQ